MTRGRLAIEMFPVTDQLTFGRDRWGRLRIALPLEQRPIAAWLHGDLQANLSMQDRYLELLHKASSAPRASDRRLEGNACRVTFWDGGWVELRSQYDRWEPLWVQFSGLVDLINEFRGFLMNEPRPDDAQPDGPDGPDGERHNACYCAELEWDDPAEDVPVTYHTFFPDSWTPEQVEEEINRAWGSDAFCSDVTTGAWSGLSNRLEIAGYVDRETGDVFPPYPVLNR